MSEQEMNEKKVYPPQDVEKSLSLMASSFYKAQLGINSIRDELRNLVDIEQERLALDKARGEKQ